MAHIIVYDAKVINTINRGEKYWNSLEIGVFQSHLDEETKEELAYYMIGTYKRNYSAFYNTFFPFERDGVWYALYSRDYTCTRVMKLPECIDIGGEDPESCGFCPVDYYVPKVKDVYMPFGFIAGCIWGDDGSFKIEFVDLRRVSEGVIKRDSRMGYIAIPRSFSRLSECISDVCMYGDDFSFDITSQNVYEFNWNEDPSPTQQENPYEK